MARQGVLRHSPLASQTWLSVRVSAFCSIATGSLLSFAIPWQSGARDLLASPAPGFKLNAVADSLKAGRGRRH